MAVTYTLKAISMLDKQNLKELSEATSFKLNLSQLAVEKDFYVTHVIQTLTQIQNDYFDLVFQGGTSLSKGYKLIERLSEDVDFRIIQHPATFNLSKNTKRKKLREFRHEIVETLKLAGFTLPNDAIRVFYEGNFMQINAAFDNADKLTYLKPHVAIECFMGDLALLPSSKSITTLIKTTLGNKCNHQEISVNCIALDETAAEKWVALTRRIANSRLRSHLNDKHLVRHLYDLYFLSQSGLLTGDYQKLIPNLLNKDREQFKKYNPTTNAAVGIPKIIVAINNIGIVLPIVSPKPMATTLVKFISLRSDWLSIALKIKSNAKASNIAKIHTTIELVPLTLNTSEGRNRTPDPIIEPIAKTIDPHKLSFLFILCANPIYSCSRSFHPKFFPKLYGKIKP